MVHEMTDWRKAIPQARDRRQSLWLVGSLGPVLLLLCLETLTRLAIEGRWRILLASTLISAIFGVLAWRLGSATRPAAGFGAVLCQLLITVQQPFPGALFPLITLFVLTFLSTRAGRARKSAIGLAESRRGRNSAQVLANLGAAGLLASSFGSLLGDSRPTMLLAALVEATSDTVSSEIGQAFGGRPILLTTLSRVEAGTDGAVTLLGTAAGIVSGALVAVVGAWSLHLSLPATGIALLAGTAGLFFDSLLGATVERRGWVGNDWVNFGSTLFAAILALVLTRA